jgi:hypothetical protein
MCIVATFTLDSAPLPEKNRATASAALLTPRHRAVNLSPIEENNPEIACPQRAYQTLGSVDGTPWLHQVLVPGGEVEVAFIIPAQWNWIGTCNGTDWFLHDCILD